MNLFVYGSLMFDVVWQRIARTSNPGVPATAHGWSIRSLQDVSYPGLVPAPPDSLAQGLLRTKVSPAALARLDAFEGPDYLRQLIAITLPDGQRLEASCDPPADWPI